jgi:hypothetical protein
VLRFRRRKRGGKSRRSDQHSPRKLKQEIIASKQKIDPLGQDSDIFAAMGRRSQDPRAASRAYAIANALEGLSRAEAARLAGMERKRCVMLWSATTPLRSTG